MIRRLIILLLIVGCDEILESIKEGCTTTTACNYNIDATKDDGSCVQPQGCNNWCESSLEVVVPDTTEVSQNGALELDCADVCGGDAEFDDCGVCDGIDGYVAGTCYDCADTPNGDAVSDNCGVCDADLSNDCVQDCAGIWGGTSWMSDCECVATDNSGDECDDCAGVPNGDAYFNQCNICINTSQGDIDYYNIFNNLDRPTDLFIDQISNECEIFYNQLTETFSEDLINVDDAYILIDGDISDNHILISSPHSQRTYRYNGDSCSVDLNEHCRDKYTGAIAQYLNQLMGCSIIVSKNKSDDPNWYDTITEGTETPAFIDMVGNPLPYKQAIKDYLSTNDNIKMIIDLHGFENTLSRSDQDIEIGTMDSLSLNGNINYCLPHIIEEIFSRHNISDINKNSSEFASINQSTVTKYITKQISTAINRNYDAIQMEVDNDYRGCEIADVKHLNFINAMIEIIYLLNQLYKL